jgi:hypothetical protein
MNDSLRWLLGLGCLCIVFLEAPQDLLQLFEDCGGAYPASISSAMAAVPDAASSVAVSADDSGDVASPDDAARDRGMVAENVGAPDVGALTLADRSRTRFEDERALKPRVDRASTGADVAGR